MLWVFRSAKVGASIGLAWGLFSGGAFACGGTLALRGTVAACGAFSRGWVGEGADFAVRFLSGRPVRCVPRCDPRAGVRGVQPSASRRSLAVPIPFSSLSRFLACLRASVARGRAWASSLVPQRAQQPRRKQPPAFSKTRAGDAGLSVTWGVTTLRVPAIRNPQLFLCPSPPPLRPHHPLPPARSTRGLEKRGQCRLIFNRSANSQNWRVNVTIPCKTNLFPTAFVY